MFVGEWNERLPLARQFTHYIPARDGSQGRSGNAKRKMPSGERASGYHCSVLTLLLGFLAGGESIRAREKRRRFNRNCGVGCTRSSTHVGDRIAAAPELKTEGSAQHHFLVRDRIVARRRRVIGRIKACALRQSDGVSYVLRISQGAFCCLEIATQHAARARTEPSGASGSSGDAVRERPNGKGGHDGKCALV